MKPPPDKKEPPPAAIARVPVERANPTTDELRELRFVQGWTLQRIGDRYGCTRERVRQLCKAAGIGKKPKLPAIKKPKKEPQFKELPFAEILRLYFDEKLRIREVAARLNVSQDLISRRLRRNGVKPRNRGTDYRKVRAPDAE